jgi:mycothiol synthase
MTKTGELLLRSASLDDVDPVAAVLDDCTRHYVDRPSTSEDAIERLEQGDAVIAFVAAGNPVGFGHVWLAASDEVRLFARVRPSARRTGVGSALLEWLERRGSERAREAGLGCEAMLTLTNWARDDTAPQLLARKGFAPVRYFLEMTVDLSATGQLEPQWPENVELRIFADGVDETELFAAFGDAFADHWGNAQTDKGEWWEELRDGATAGFEPSLWFLAVEGTTIAGFSICRKREVDGKTIGWISLLGVRPGWRGRGLGESLLQHSLNTLHGRGLQRVALNVDAENITSALRLYTKLGMKPKPSFTIWSKRIAAEAAP